MNEQTQRKINSALRELSLFEYLVSCEQIPGDLSPRRYFRCILNQNPKGLKSIMLMVFDSVKPPESEAKFTYTSDYTFIEIGKLLFNNHIPVPEIFLDQRELGVIALEDLGSRTLISLLNENYTEALRFYNNSLDLIHAFQAIDTRSDFFAFTRSLEEEVYKRETNNFVKFYVKPIKELKKQEQVEKCINKLSSQLSNFKRTFVHRDFHSWNLMIDSRNRLRLIDFQDALMGTSSYDLVALLHERDIDGILNTEDIKALEDNYFAKFDKSVREYEYPRVQLQRDIKTTGLFTACVKERNLPSYGKWIPGNFNRMKSTLLKILDEDKDFQTLYELVLENI